MVEVLVFGYGSLINTESRNQTVKTNEVWRGTLRGYRRAWEAQPPGYTCVGVHENTRSKVNGVIFTMDEADLANLDAREMRYDRVELPRNSLQTHCGSFLPPRKTYTYVTTKPKAPTYSNPVRMSYLNICLQGCLEYGPDMLLEFLSKTADLPAMDSRAILNDMDPYRCTVEDEFECAVFLQYEDIEDSLKVGEELLCEACAEESKCWTCGELDCKHTLGNMGED